MSDQPFNSKCLVVKEASENNLKSISVSIPHQSFTVITGVSGSGKSSLAYNVIFKESQRRFLSSFSSFSRLYTAKLEKPKANSITGLQAALAVKQQSTAANPHSTVGTLSGLSDHLRLLFARMGRASCVVCGKTFANSTETVCRHCAHERPRQLASLFSFNSYHGACKDCKGLGLREQIDVNKLISDPSLSLREGALVPTTPTGYIVYSQVTVDALNTVCKAHGFDVDTPWQSLTDDQRHVILYGSEKVKVLFGKHALESRLKWKGITARPRVEGFYKGIIPIMEDILRRDRNENILRFASAFACKTCKGTRLSKEALAVDLAGTNIAELSKLSVDALEKRLMEIRSEVDQQAIFDAIMEKASKRISYLKMLGLGYLSLSREATSLSGGEAQRIRLAAQIGSGLQGVLYVLDEPSAGLHPYDNQNLLKMLKALRDNGNTVLVVEHDEDTIREADYLIDIGPKAGNNGGQLIYEGNPDTLLQQPENYPDSLTAHTLSQAWQVKQIVREGFGFIEIFAAQLHNLRQIDVSFRMGALNVVTGLSGAGKSTLVHQVLAKSIRQNKAIGCDSWDTTLAIDRIIEVNQSPIGRTPRSNPATYTGLFEVIRSLFAEQPLSKILGFNKGQFSFNTAGGRCEHCNGAGRTHLGMHFLGDVEVACESCGGKRFNDATLEVTYRGKNIFEVLEMTFDEASKFFENIPPATKIIDQLIRLEVGYLRLGQPSTTLSGGEAQRVKLASELHKTTKGNGLYLLDEPTLGLHKADVAALLTALNDLIEQQNTVIVIEHDPTFILQADHIIDLGPEGGENGGALIFSGKPSELLNQPDSLTAKALNRIILKGSDASKTKQLSWNRDEFIQLKGISTHNLNQLDVKIPHGKTTVITGVSGSGKSALAFDTLYTECRNRFTESYTAYARRMMSKLSRPQLEEGSGFSPAIAIQQNNFHNDPRSTVGTMTGLSESYRLLFSRIGKTKDNQPHQMPASLFSFNHAKAACEMCNGLGRVLFADPQQFITHPEKALTTGAMDGTKPGSFFGEADGQYVQTLKTVGKIYGIDFELPYIQLDDTASRIALYGCGDEVFDVDWQFNRAGRKGNHQLRTKWKGFANLIEEDYHLKKQSKRGEAFEKIIREKLCPSCKGARLNSKVLSVKVDTLSIAEVSAMNVKEAWIFFEQLPGKLSGIEKAVALKLQNQIQQKLKILAELGLSYLSADRPAASLSGGEARRVRMASQLEADLCGITYVIDEPTTGLHPRDTQKLLGVLDKLKALGNTMVYVEHDPEVIRHADYVIELGPGAGKYGGNLVFSGGRSTFLNTTDSLTAAYLNQKFSITSHEIDKAKPVMCLKGAAANNLQHINVEIPTAQLIAISGVSGSGKTSLAFDVIAESFKAGKPINCSSIDFADIQQLVVADQEEMSSSVLSTVASFTEVFELIRNLFALLPESKSLGLKKQHFSFNNAEGSCPNCKGQGKIKVSLDFLSDVYTTCEVCEGKRFKPKVLLPRWKNKSINEVLEMEVHEAANHFKSQKKIVQKLEVLEDVGLGYLRLGQTTNTLSGGESQRLKLANELLKGKQLRTLYIFDEPTSGLHFKDVEHLLKLFKRLVNDGHTVMVVEHNLHVITAADWLIDMGPEAGSEGGKIIYNGELSDCLSVNKSATINCLKTSLVK